jgi:KipI family sensor histidine kinase inhibitor
MLDVPGATSIECQRRIWWLAHQFRSHAGVREIVPGMNNLTVELDHAAPDLESLLESLQAGWSHSNAMAYPSRRIEIPVRYGGPEGPDLDEVARQSGLPREEVVRLHQSGEYTVFFLGFQPGFAYLGGMDRRLATARRKEPRLAVPAGSLAIGGDRPGSIHRLRQAAGN